MWEGRRPRSCKNHAQGLPCWSSGQDSALPMQGARSGSYSLHAATKTQCSQIKIKKKKESGSGSPNLAGQGREESVENSSDVLSEVTRQQGIWGGSAYWTWWS